MTLEHYPGMTEEELARVEAEAGERWPLQASLIVHRVGTLKPGDNIVLVVTASAHRAGRLRGRRVPDGLPQDPRPVLEEGAGPPTAPSAGSTPARATTARRSGGRPVGRTQLLQGVYCRHGRQQHRRGWSRRGQPSHEPSSRRRVQGTSLAIVASPWRHKCCKARLPWSRLQPSPPSRHPRDGARELLAESVGGAAEAPGA